MKRCLITLALLVGGCVAAAAQDCYNVDPSNSSVSYQVQQAGAPFNGSFRRFAGELCFAPGPALRVTRVQASLDPASVDSGLPELDVVLRDKEFFDVRKYPNITLTVVPLPAPPAALSEVQMLRATLEIKGKRGEVDAAVRVQPAGGKLMLSASMTLDRLRYGIGSGEWANTQWLGAPVRLDIKATLLKKP